jgi:hypothetical protein
MILLLQSVEQQMGSTQSLETLRRPLPTASNTDALCATRRLALKGAPKGRREIVSRRCFTGRATLWGISMGRLLLGISNPIGAPIGIAKGMPVWSYGHKKTDGRIGRFIMGLPRWALSPLW